MGKNIDNTGGGAGGIDLSGNTTLDLTEQAPNLYLTNTNFQNKLTIDPSYKNAEKIYSAPISAPGGAQGQILQFDGSLWNPTNDVRFGNGSVINASGINPANPDAIEFTKFSSIQKTSGDQKILTIETIPGDAFFVILSILGRDDTTEAQYINRQEFFIKNVASVMTEVLYSGYSDTEYTRSFNGEDFELNLNTVNDASVSVQVRLITVVGAEPPVSIP